MLVTKYKIPIIFLTTNVEVCAPHPSKISAMPKRVCREIGNNYYV